MACLEMYNSDHHHHHPCGAPMSPRISFSNDFVDIQQPLKQQERTDEAPPASSDFEFSVTNYSMMSADELFFKGRLLPYKDNKPLTHRSPTTLREELLLHHDDDASSSAFSLRPPKSSSSTRWKAFLGLRKTHIASSKKADKPEPTTPSLLLNQGSPSINLASQDVMNEGDSSCSDLEIGI
ncbi:hypothetical protein HN51_006757 [Arachis hypogaea]|uniref:Membrane-associated kinase regulator n=1 Tax=Arachis hypogaea TaxID=3818 RepID=A0A444WT64_ARAHY|nr:uncharacterized protein LOC112800593 [Arachis hypogaea]QHO40744.1 uncharacterized protein DS421_5g139770 [Arachis hypogaea]RYQ80595.1 hypothetical protein Ahy_Scaffold1g106901 isoform A [Arachis hypogaea]